MKIGDYVRTKSNGIQKIDEEGRINLGLIRLPFHIIKEEELLKSSPNIIDLIEKHDILKIEEQKGIYTICEVEEFRDPYVNYKFLGVRLENQSRVRKLYELNIKSIVTKEQFESMEYRIGE